MILMVVSLISSFTLTAAATPITGTILVPDGQTMFDIVIIVNEDTAFAGMDFAMTISGDSAVYDTFIPAIADTAPSPETVDGGIQHFGFFAGYNVCPPGERVAGTLKLKGYTDNQTLTINIVQMTIVRVDGNNQANKTYKDDQYEFTVQRAISGTTYTVTFDSDGGSAVAPIAVPQGEKMAKPADPVKTGYTFGGWYTDTACTNAWDFANDPVTNYMTLYAKWTWTLINSYTVTWHTDGGTPAPTQTSTDRGGTITQPAAMTKSGYTFGGWYENVGLTGAAVSFPVTGVTGVKEYWAKWTLESSGPSGSSITTHTVTFNTSGGVRTGGGLLTQTVNTGAAATAPILTREGYIFNGWDRTFTNVTANITVTALWLEEEDIPDTPDPPLTGYEQYFDDVTDTLYSWAEPAVYALAEAGVVKGIANRIYSPAANIKRGDFILMLTRAYGLDEPFTENFPDVPVGSYYYDAIGSAKALGIARGYGNNEFHPEAFISRQEMMTIIDRTMDTIEKPLPRGSATDLNIFSDRDIIADYALDSVAALVKSGIIVGSDNRVNPLGYTTRAEMAVALYRLMILTGDLTAD
jgi:uncharacterized repeat protein (TIGR02543 family)